MSVLTGIAQRLLIIFLLGVALPVLAHEVRPASFEITEQADGSLECRWRQPVRGDYTLPIHPILSSGWLEPEPDERIITDSSLIYIWQVQADIEALSGQELSISGLDRTITDVLVTVSKLDGQVQTWLIKAGNPVLRFDSAAQTSNISDYLWLGMHHIWSGADHLLYVLALMLLIHGTRSLVATISCFTLAHSITLACATLNLVQLQAAPVEAVISLSIVYVAVELVHIRQGRPGLAQQRPWLIAFIFGLLHGFGFAGALQSIGLPAQALGSALLLFNVGIEIGQLLFIFSILALYFLLNRLFALSANIAERARLLAPYGIGSIAAFWFIERLFALV